MFLNLPMIVADAVILNANGFSVLGVLPGLLTNQILITAAVLIPMMALAAVTTGLVQVLVAVLTFAAIAIARSLLLFRAPLAGPFDWVGTTIAVLGVALVAAAVVVWQYSRRRTGAARAFAAAGFVAVFALSAAVPFSFAFWIQSRISNRMDRSAVQIGVDNSDSWFAHRVAPRDDRVVVQAPIKVSGIPQGMILRPDALIVTLEAPDGKVWKFDSGPWSRMEGQGPSNWPRIMVDSAFFEKIRNQPVRLRASAFATLYGNQRQTPIPYDVKRVAVPRAGLCTAMRTESITHVTCRYPFRNPPDAVTIFFGQAGRDARSVAILFAFPGATGQQSREPVDLAGDETGADCTHCRHCRASRPYSSRF